MILFEGRPSLLGGGGCVTAQFAHSKTTTDYKYKEVRRFNREKSTNMIFETVLF